MVEIDPKKTLLYWEVDSEDIVDGLTELLLDKGFTLKIDPSKPRGTMVGGGIHLVKCSVRMREGIEIEYGSNGRGMMILLKLYPYPDGNLGYSPDTRGIRPAFYKVQRFLESRGIPSALRRVEVQYQTGPVHQYPQEPANKYL